MNYAPVVPVREPIDEYTTALYAFMGKVEKEYKEYKSKESQNGLHGRVTEEENNLVSALRAVPVNIRGKLLENLVNFLLNPKYQLYETLDRLKKEKLLVLRI